VENGREGGESRVKSRNPRQFWKKSSLKSMTDISARPTHLALSNGRLGSIESSIEIDYPVAFYFDQHKVFNESTYFFFF